MLFKNAKLFYVTLHEPSVWSAEKQNHRMVGIGRDLCGSSSPTPLPKQGHLQQAAQDLVQTGLECLQRKRLHSLFWATCSSAPSPSEGRSSSSCSDGTSYASVCARWPLSCLWAPLKRVWPHPPDTHPSDIYRHLLGPLAAFSRLNKPSSLSLSS